VVELPKPPWYRRFGVVFVAANLVVAAVLVATVIALWPRAAQRPVAPANDRGGWAPSRAGRTPRPRAGDGPDGLDQGSLAPGVLWQQRGGAGSVGGRFDAPGRWRVVWSFNCQSFAKYGGGNFKLSGAGAFAEVSVQRFGVRGRGVLRVTDGGRGRLTIESVCDRWMVKAVAP
jgi:hypothetical protein